MIKSMTGYGKAEVEIAGKNIIAEIRSLNSKQLDLSIRLPQAYRPMENEIRSRIMRGVQRGKVDFYISLDSGMCAPSTVNRELFEAYMRQLDALATNVGLGGNETTRSLAFAAILRMPEVVGATGAAIPEEESAAIMSITDMAVECLDRFRIQEGGVLMADMLSRVDRILELKNSIKPYEQPRIEVYRNRIKENIAAMNIPLDSNRLEQEMIFHIEKLDITEEKVRLNHHCRYFHEVAAAEEGAGRKLGFIAQEMGREINTLGSKANDANIQKIVVEMKDELEKVKEQILNIL